MNDHQSEPSNTVEKGDLTAGSMDSRTITKKHFLQFRPKTILFGLAIIITILGLTYAVMFVPQKNDQQNAKKQATYYDSPSKLVSSVAPYLTGKSPNVSTINSLGGSTTNGTLLYVVPPSKPADAQFHTLPLESSGAGIVNDSIASAENYNLLAKFFANNNFILVKKVGKGTQPLSLSRDTVVISYAVYESPNYLCSISHVDATSTELSNHLVSVGCANKESYTSASKSFASFYDIYKASNTSANSDTVLGKLVQKEQANGDSYAILYQEDAKNPISSKGSLYFNGYYYKTSVDNAWKFFKSTNVAIDCAEFNTDLLKKAFSGADCYNVASRVLGKV